MTFASALLRRADEAANNCTTPISQGEKIGFGIAVPILVLLSGVFAGLTLGYMSLDETQLSVLAISGTELQKKYAKKIIPIRKNGHLLLITLILANMIVNETLPVVSDNLFGGGIPAVVVSTALIVIFAEIIPQTICTRYGLVVGAKMAFFVRILIVIFWVIAFPVSKLLEWILGPHHGIIYRRSELKELIAMHAEDHHYGRGAGGGELKHDTAAIIGHTLDLQEKVVKDAMTPISDVFMLSIDSVLDYATLTKIHKTGHSRIPVYIEVDVPISLSPKSKSEGTQKFKKIVGILLVKQCVLLDPEDATPLRSIPLNKVPPIAYDEPLLNVLDRFQEGRSHMAIVSRVPRAKRAASVVANEVVKPALTRRFLNKFTRDSDSSSDEEDLEKGAVTASKTEEKKLEQTMPADALLPKENADKFLQGLDQYTNPLGIITLEDVLEELIGEEIFDEFDLQGAHALAASTYVPPEAQAATSVVAPTTPGPVASTNNVPPTPAPSHKSLLPTMTLPTLPKLGMSMLRTRSAPGTPRGGAPGLASAPPAAVDAGKEELGGIKEMATPNTSPGEDNESKQLALDDEKKEIEGDEKRLEDPFKAPTSELPTIVVQPEPQLPTQASPKSGLHRSSSIPPHVAATPVSSTPGRGSPAPTTLTEAVLRGRQTRVSTSAGEGGGVPANTGTVRVTKGRFKSTPIEPGLSMPRTKGGKGGEEKKEGAGGNDEKKESK